jgi:hypothetical protein
VSPTRRGSNATWANGAPALLAAASRVSSASARDHWAAGTYCRMTECHTTVSVPGRSSTPDRNVSTPARSTSAGTSRATRNAPSSRAARAS